MTATGRQKGGKRRQTSKRGASLWALQLSSALGIAAAVVVAVGINILAARHYERWDFTEVGLFTLSPVTVQTLRTLGEPVEVYVLRSNDDPLSLTLRHLLEAYRAESSLIRPKFVDPDRHPAELIGVQQKFGIVAGKTEDGQVVTDAAIIVAKGKRHHFITAADLFEVRSGQEDRARPQVEEVLTAGIRQVHAGTPPKVCVTTGHGELSLEVGGTEGLLSLGSRLDKLNYQVEALPALRQQPGKDPIGECKVLIVAAPTAPVPEDDVARFVRYVEQGGNALVFAGPELTESGFVKVGLDPLLALASVRKNEDFVFERDPRLRTAMGAGEMFVASPARHPITEGFITAEGAPSIVVVVASSLAAIDGGAVEPSPLLVTSEQAFGMSLGSFIRWRDEQPEPEPLEGDRRGPLTLAYAAELPKTKAKAAHGPRLVIVGSNAAIWGGNWEQPQTRGTALFVENTVSWLADEPIVLDIPRKPASPLGLNITDDSLQSVALKVLVFLPLGTLLIGLAIFLRRRASEGRSRSRLRGSEP
ncbi:MAG: GldG family protein [Deltaproteobacteria bacterium]|nr:GldG family protein [Deltaproteobacteria bacterium]